MNGREFSFDELVDETDEWWFPLDSAVALRRHARRRRRTPSTRSAST